jgi:uncharacterized membrane protein
MSIESASRRRPSAWEDPRVRNQAAQALLEAAFGIALLGAATRKQPRLRFWLGIAAGILAAPRLRQAAEAVSPILEFEGSVLVDAPLEKIRGRLGDFNLWPQFMTGIESVTPDPDGHLVWQGRPFLNLKTPFKWSTQILHHTREEGIHWRSLPGERIHMEGSLLAESFSDLRTRVSAYLRIDPPLHPLSTLLGSSIGRALGLQPLRIFETDLERLQSLLVEEPRTKSASLAGI